MSDGFPPSKVILNATIEPVGASPLEGIRWKIGPSNGEKSQRRPGHQGSWQVVEKAVSFSISLELSRLNNLIAAKGGSMVIGAAQRIGVQDSAAVVAGCDDPVFLIQSENSGRDPGHIGRIHFGWGARRREVILHSKLIGAQGKHGIVVVARDLTMTARNLHIHHTICTYGCSAAARCTAAPGEKRLDRAAGWINGVNSIGIAAATADSSTKIRSLLMLSPLARARGAEP